MSSILVANGTRGPMSLAAFWKQSKTFAHRGYCKDFPENTHGAFNAAIRLGFVGLETDLRATRDGHLVLCHDATLTRIGGKAGTIVAEQTRPQLERVQLAGGQSLMFFDQLLRLFADQAWILDVKPETGFATVELLRPMIAANPEWFQTSCAFLFWDRKQEEALRSILPHGNFCARSSECWRAGLAVLAGVPIFGAIVPGKCYAIPPSLHGIPLYRERIIRAFHQKGAAVIAYLPRTADEVAQAQAAGCDALLLEEWFRC